MSKSNSKNPVRNQKSTQKSSSQWNQCMKCEFIILKSSNDEHTCFQLDNFIETNKPFLFNNLIFSTTFEHSKGKFSINQTDLKYILYQNEYLLQKKELIKDLQIGKEYLFDYAFLNPATMRLADLKLNDLLLLKDLNTNTDCVAVCWPSASVDLSQIALNKNYLALNCIPLEQPVVCSKLTTRSKPASLINLEYVNSANGFSVEEDLSLVMAYLKEIYLGKCILSKQSISVVYMGQKLVFKIVSISAKEIPKDKKLNNHESSDLSSNFETMLNLNEKTATFTEVNMSPSVLSGNLAKQLQIDTLPVEQIFKVNSDTQFGIESNAKSEITELPEQIVKFKFSDIGGLDKEIELLKEFFIQPFNHSGLYKQIGLIFLF